MEEKAQGALEYLLLIGGAVLVAAIVLSLVTGLAAEGQHVAQIGDDRVRHELHTIEQMAT